MTIIITIVVGIIDLISISVGDGHHIIQVIIHGTIHGIMVVGMIHGIMEVGILRGIITDGIHLGTEVVIMAMEADSMDTEMDSMVTEAVIITDSMMVIIRVLHEIVLAEVLVHTEEVL